MCRAQAARGKPAVPEGVGRDLDRTHPLYAVVCILAAAAIQAVLLWKLRGGMEKARADADPEDPVS
ncbi:hypothetical protein SAMN05421543_12430 [Alicyclobacillus macrosporangiidus]|uniref:Uncharacterized protein n=1 Tax=Alicyclobacillus macrosporangiidus TaxID=392015 RepID=A0A1I7L3Y8_9BACL|nr:hypothetical protein SAMN05421543_12430 [Alicyclobacillus macrosporangiidus]